MQVPTIRVSGPHGITWGRRPAERRRTAALLKTISDTIATWLSYTRMNVMKTSNRSYLDLRTNYVDIFGYKLKQIVWTFSDTNWLIFKWNVPEKTQLCEDYPHNFDCNLTFVEIHHSQCVCAGDVTADHTDADFSILWPRHRQCRRRHSHATSPPRTPGNAATNLPSVCDRLLPAIWRRYVVLQQYLSGRCQLPLDAAVWGCV